MSRRREDGTAAVQLAFVLPVLLVLAGVVTPLVRAGWEYLVLTRATSTGVRYATRTDHNPRAAPEGLTRRPTAEEVVEHVRNAASGLDEESVVVTVDPVPSQSLSGETITVTTSYPISFGPAATAVEAITGAFLSEGFVHTKTVTVSARGRQE